MRAEAPRRSASAVKAKPKPAAKSKPKPKLQAKRSLTRNAIGGSARFVGTATGNAISGGLPSNYGRIHSRDRHGNEVVWLDPFGQGRPPPKGWENAGLKPAKRKKSKYPQPKRVNVNLTRSDTRWM